MKNSFDIITNDFEMVQNEIKKLLQELPNGIEIKYQVKEKNKLKILVDIPFNHDTSYLYEKIFIRFQSWMI